MDDAQNIAAVIPIGRARKQSPRRVRGSIVAKKGKDGVTRYYGRYVDADGKRKNRLLSTVSLADARDVLATIKSNVIKGNVGMERPTPEQLSRKTITLQAVFDKFMVDYRPPKVKDIEEYRKQTRTVFTVRVLPELGSTPAAAITPTDIERLRDRLTAEEYAPGSVQWTLARLSKVYNWARKTSVVDCGNPTSGCERPTTHPTLDYLSKLEVSRLLAHAAKEASDTHPVIAAAVYAGLRKGELFGLRWIDVHLDAGRLDINRSYLKLPKSGKPRHLPLHPQLASILRAWQERCPKTDEGLVFPVRERRGGYRMGQRHHMLGLEDLLKAAGCHVPQKPWHALRHTFASHFMMAGGNILTLQKLLGHAKLEMTLIYAHLAPDFMAGEVARMSFGGEDTSRTTEGTRDV